MLYIKFLVLNKPYSPVFLFLFIYEQREAHSNTQSLAKAGFVFRESARSEAVGMTTRYIGSRGLLGSNPNGPEDYQIWTRTVF